MGTLKLIFFLTFFLRVLFVKSDETIGSKSESDDRFVFLYYFLPPTYVQDDAQPTQESISPFGEDVPKDQDHFVDIHREDLPTDRQYDYDQLTSVKIISSLSSSSESSTGSKPKSKSLSSSKSSRSESSSSSESADKKKQQAFTDSEIFWHFMRLLDGPDTANYSEEKDISKEDSESKDDKYSENKTPTLVKKPTEFKKSPQFEKIEQPAEIEKSDFEAIEQIKSSDYEIKKSNTDEINRENSSAESSEESKESEYGNEPKDVSSESSIPVDERDDSKSITDYEKSIFVPLAPYEDDQSPEEIENEDFYFIEPLTPAPVTTIQTPNENDEIVDKTETENTQDRSKEDDKKESSESLSKLDVHSNDTTIDENKEEILPETESVPSIGSKSMSGKHSEENEISRDESEASDKQEKDETTDGKPMGHISFGRFLKKFFLGFPL